MLMGFNNLSVNNTDKLYLNTTLLYAFNVSGLRTHLQECK